MNFLNMKNELLKLNLDIFTLNDVVKLTGQSKDVVKNKLSLLSKQQKIFHLKKGYYSLNNIFNKFNFQKLYKNTYIALYSALEYYESTTQRFNNLDLITKNILNNQSLDEMKIIFHNVKKKMFFGFKKIKINNTDVFISNIEKTIIDCVYFSSKVYLTDVNDFIRKFKDEINIEILCMYLKKIDSSVLNKRIGYLMELNGIELKKMKFNNKFEKFNKNLQSKGVRNEKWKIIINEDVDNGEK